ncbi:S8 family peptidase [Faecalicatena contorta]|uniref:Subtilase family protein n=1 Tax=Faecalicatena contorta TaxID=39482 RepID=A0A315ZTQ1_9FIRM|nr:S8 family peptidase [Faecalicatena contorta]PWJ48931.1 subtilase family protein [Faecalicatena contorta]SUQ15021.1 Subtilase family protein [Faecalicatena contorta]
MKGTYMHKALDDNYVDLLIDTQLAENLRTGYEITPINERNSILHSPVDMFNMCSLGIYPYHIFPTIYTLCSMVSLESSGISVAHSNPNFGLFGQGVIIGFVDTGINYQHQAFLNSDGTSRILYLWDQNIEGSGIKPDAPFGSVYDKTLINLALLNQKPLSIVPSFDEDGHGTMLAGIAAGSIDESQGFSGVAPNAEIVVVKLARAKHYNRAIFNIPDTVRCYAETNILIGIEYIRKIAERLKRPLIICFGMGSSQSDHDGHSALSLYLNNISTTPRKGVCISAGNEGNARRHYSETMSNEQSDNTFELRIGELDKNFSMEIWQRSPGKIAVVVESPHSEKTSVIQPQFGQCFEQTFVFSNSKIYINNIIVENETGEQLILIRLSNAVSGIWKIRVIKIDTITMQFNAWLPSGDIITEETYFLRSNPYTTVTAPGNARNPVTVTAYNQNTNSILPESSRGFTTSNVVTPDLAAPGFNIKCPTIINTYGSATGTGAAAAHSAGIMALVLEWAVIKGNYTSISGRDISRLLIRGAARENTIEYPNRIWGYGKIDIIGLFRGLI